MFASLGDWYDVRTVNIAKFRPECHSWTSILDTLKLASDSLNILSTEIIITYTLFLSFKTCVQEAKLFFLSIYILQCSLVSDICLVRVSLVLFLI